MKSLVSLVLFLFLIIKIYSQSEDEKIYKQVITDFVSKFRKPNISHSSTMTVLVFDSLYFKETLVGSRFYESYFQKGYKKLAQQTFIDFLEKLKAELVIKKSKIPDIEIVMIGQESLNARSEFYSKYPNWNLLMIELSNIGFNTLKNQAFLYYSYIQGPGVGGGVYLVYEKKKRNWKLKKIIPAWAN